MDAYLMLCRSEEELIMLEQESKNLVQYYRQRQVVVSMKLEALSSVNDNFSRGAVAMLKSLLCSNKHSFDEAEKTCLFIQSNSEAGLLDYSDSDISDDENYSIEDFCWTS